jgi:hypothetical protein
VDDRDLLREFVASELLFEARHDALITDMTRKVVALVRDMKSRRIERQYVMSWNVPGIHQDKHILLRVRAKLASGDSVDLFSEGESDVTIMSGARVPYVEVSVEVTSPRKRPDGSIDPSPVLRHLWANVMGLVAHELEHVLQGEYGTLDAARPSKLDDPEYDPDDPSDTLTYLTAPTEVAAHVRGFYQTAKRLRRPLSTVMRAAISQYESAGELSRIEASRVMAVWTKWAKSHLHAAKMSA